jgi:uncharacterized protein (DUF2336 family)
MARVQGAQGIGPIARRPDLGPALKEAIRAVRGGAVCVVDVLIDPEYDARVGAGESSAERRAVEPKRG